MTTAATALKKLTAARVALSKKMIERDDEIDLALTALVAGEHLLLVGPPGTGKSMLCDAVSELIHGTKFAYLMTKFTSPEEILGPVSLSELKADRYVRITAGKMPEAEVVFLDEIFKSSSAILNTLLKILNERVYDAGRGPVSCPLRLCVAASNEWPTGEGQQDLGALFDRFVLRRTVRPIRTADGKKRLRFGPRDAGPLGVSLTREELDAAREAAAALPWSAEAVDAYEQIHRELAKEGIVVGDRRDEKAVKIARAAAWLDGAAEVLPVHLGVLADCLWDSPEDHPAKAAAVVSRIANLTGARVNQLLTEAEEIIAGADVKNIVKVTEAAQKLTEVSRSLDKLKGNPRAERANVYVKNEVQRLKRAAVEHI